MLEAYARIYDAGLEKVVVWRVDESKGLCAGAGCVYVWQRGGSLWLRKWSRYARG